MSREAHVRICESVRVKFPRATRPFWALVDLGFDITTKQQLRLRGIDAPEISSREGQAAKRFVERELKDIPYVIVTSTQSDKYDRYLADVFYETKSGEQYLNNRLLEKRLANRV